MEPGHDALLPTWPMIWALGHGPDNHPVHKRLQIDDARRHRYGTVAALVSTFRTGEVGGVGDPGLGDGGREVALVIGDEPVGAEAHGGGEVGGVGGSEPVTAGEGGREFGGGAVDRAQV